MIDLTEQTIDVSQVLCHVQSPEAGAVVLFLGTTRQFTRGRETVSLDYECYGAMARTKLQELETEAMQRWPLRRICMIHRIGHLELGQASIAIAVSAPHRQAAFEAGKISENGGGSESGALIEIWSYAPSVLSSEGETVDRLSLYLTLRNSPDERVQGELATMMEGMQW